MSHEHGGNLLRMRAHEFTRGRALMQISFLSYHIRERRGRLYTAFAAVFIKVISFARLRSTPLGVFSKGCGGGGGEPFREYFMGMAV